MPRARLTTRIERELEQAGINAVVEESEDAIILSGRVDSDEARQAAEDLVAGLAPDRRIDNRLEVEMILPETVGDRSSDEPSPSDLPDTVAEIRDWGAEIEPDFTDQEPLTDPTAAAGPSGSAEDRVQEGDEVYVPPSDPVVAVNRHGRADVLGGLAPDSMDEVEVEPSASDVRLGDEAIEDAIRRELRADASTTDLDVRVVVRQGVAHLIGRVPTMEDAENAESVAYRVPGVREVIEDLDIDTLQ
jgi:osmotically-inducible protein OsmY